MRLNALKFDDEEHVEEITVSMTEREAALIAKVFGKFRCDGPHSDIYSCLVGAVFNRLYDDGVNEVDVEVEPKIVYEDNK